jgi:hypothetical protein
MVFTYLTYFVVGLVYDILITLYYLAISDRRSVQSGFWSFFITYVGALVLYELFPSASFEVELFFYALGCGVGTFFTVRYDKQRIKIFRGILKMLRFRRKGQNYV